MGAWRRDGIAHGGGPLVEDERVVWLQVGDVYADLRAGPRPLAFAGRTTTEGGLTTWHHEVSTEPPAADSGRLEQRGDLLVETGEGYVEHWRPLPGPLVPGVVLVAPALRAVRVGPRAVVVTASGACLLVDGAVTEVVGTAPDLARLPATFTQPQQPRRRRDTPAP